MSDYDDRGAISDDEALRSAYPLEFARREQAKLRQALEDYAQHNSGCSAKFGAEYRCRCGWREMAAELGVSEGPEK